MRHILVVLLFLLFSIIVISCKKESADIQLAPLTDYYPLQVGNSYTYRLDSTVYLAFGTTVATISYLAKDSIVDTYSDNTGRAAYLVYRYLTDTLMKKPFTYNTAYSIT